ncbi:outer membrane protein assembly factor BamC [Undibacterium cyanobacteriorum]|uniref:Outer membrane protein assembly factor BamC n=1 Tax=Undibacterium cyanobacteriorum TaxID=3073561 RepID=A0ABY9REC2_9BURK|nr:outer membrane protein assembly factor BamC [Undibacterium sp. 20NA77.5]WMW79014.1 outer membrane protein assembly factor BamC [Undibacterium sp. 20NA77.5]
MVKSVVANKKLVRAMVWAGVIGVAGATTGCTFTGNLTENRVDYRSAAKAKTVSLEVPPDLTQIRRDSRFSIPENDQGSATASSYLQQRGGGVVSTASGVVAPNQLKDARIARDGSQRYLAVKGSPELIWPILKDFWQDNGFLINVENESTGVMETDWAENRGKIPQDMIRATLGKVFDSLYSTGERDKFRTRVERGANGEVEVYISHRGAQEIYTGMQKDTTAWTSRANDPSLEAEFLSRLMIRLGSDAPKAKAQIAATTNDAQVQSNVAPRSQLLTLNDLYYLQTDEGFDRSWRRVGLALDRIGFTIEDRDRSKGLYYVQYIDQDIDAKKKGASEGFFAKLFSWGSSETAKDGQKYRILVKESGDVSHVTVHGEDGKVSATPVAQKILKVLNEQLK